MDKELLAAFSTIVNHLKSHTNDPNTLENFKGTPERCLKAFKETNLPEQTIREMVAKEIGIMFPISKGRGSPPGMVNQGPIIINSWCPHHLAQVRYEAFVSYLPVEGAVLGLSKITRIAKTLGKRPVLQEELIADIADAFFKSEYSKFPAVTSHGSCVMLTGIHCCMACRGIGENAMTLQVEKRGTYWESDMENRFYAAVDSLRKAHPF